MVQDCAGRGACATYPMPIMHTLDRQHIQILEADVPDAPVLVYGHGFGCNHRMWRQVTPAFQRTHRQVLFDYPGSGLSDPAGFDPVRHASLDGYVQDLLEMLDALGLRAGVHFVGHSVSCSIGLLAAALRPEWFADLVLIGPSPCFLNHPPDYHGGFESADLEGMLQLMDQNYIGWASLLGTIVSGEKGEKNEAGEAGVAGELSQSFCSTDPKAARVFARATFFADNRADLPRVRTPSLILQHARDSLAPQAVGEYLHHHLHDSSLRVLDVAGHCAHMSHPDQVIDAMRGFYART